MPTLIHQRVEQCRAGTYPKLIARMTSGWAVMGDVQFLPGYCLLLPDPVVRGLNDMDEAARKQFLYDMTVLGDAVLAATDAVHLNYEMLGNVEPALHAHVFPRYESEDPALRTKPVWFYDWDAGPAFDAERDGALMAKIREQLDART